MPQVPAEKSYFTFKGGLNTDASPIAFPEESTSDEANFELLKDGSRRRRRGLDQESGGVTDTLSATLGTNDIVSSVKWPNASGTGDNFIVIQRGSTLIFYADSLTPSSGIESGEIDLTEFLVATKAASDIAQNPVSMDVGHRARLLVAGRYLEPIYVEWDGTDFTATQINLFERDFVGIIDDIPVSTTPATTTAAHTYNLRARGWKQVNIAAYQTAKSKYPSKAMWPWLGYRRTVVAGITETDGTWAFNADKMDSELFGTTSAPLGHLILNPFDTETTGVVGSVDFIDNLSFGGSTATITAASHGLSNGNTVVIRDNLYLYTDGVSQFAASIDGTYVISGVTANTFDISYTAPGVAGSVVYYGNFYLLTSTEVVTNPTPFTTTERPQIVKWYAGRAWWMGVQDEKLKDRVYFSQITEDASQYGKCYQAADPTDTIFNELVSTDGGIIIVPELNNVTGAKIFNDSLLIFSTFGVWQIRGSNGVFSADGYSVRKIAEHSATSKLGIIQTTDNIYWSGFEGILTLFQDPQTGYLTVQNISENVVQVLWNSLTTTQQSRVKMAFDKAQNRIYILYPSLTTYAANRYDHCLIYSLQHKVYYKFIFPSALANYIVDIFSITPVEDGENNKNIKFLVQTGTRTQFKVCDMDQTDFVDFDGTEQVPYMVTGYDNLSDFQRFKQAPVLHVYCKKTETGYTASGSDLIPTDESSVLMRPVWDWSDHTNSGKFGPQQQVYRHHRYYQPVDVNDTFDDGAPVVVTRNKLRGRGRVLHLRFDGETAKNAHILGWSIQYKANRKV